MRTKLIACVCVTCGAAFTRYPSNIAQGTGKYCSRPCFDSALKAASTAVHRSCAVCGKPLTVRASQASRRGRYCSRECWHARPALGVTRTCPVCGTAFYLYPRDLRRRQGHCCSQACAAVMRRTSDGVRRHDARYKEWRRAVLERDAFTCRRCGEPGGDLEAHHIELWSKRPDLRYDPANGLTLHEACHYLVHVEQGTWGRH